MEKTNQENLKGKISEQEDYKVEIKYTKEAEQNKLIRFTAKTKDGSFEISAEKLVELVASYVNSETLAPMFVETERVNVVQVRRQFAAVLTEDKKKGDEIRVDYHHPYPIEFALLEEAFKIATIDEDRGYLPLTKDFIESVKGKLQPEMEEFVKKFYKSYNTIDLEKKS